MAFADTQTVSNAALNALHILTRPFVAIGSFLVSLADASSQAHALNALADLSDADLAAKGTTRNEQIRYILRGYMHV